MQTHQHGDNSEARNSRTHLSRHIRDSQKHHKEPQEHFINVFPCDQSQYSRALNAEQSASRCVVENIYQEALLEIGTECNTKR